MFALFSPTGPCCSTAHRWNGGDRRSYLHFCQIGCLPEDTGRPRPPLLSNSLSSPGLSWPSFSDAVSTTLKKRTTSKWPFKLCAFCPTATPASQSHRASLMDVDAEKEIAQVTMEISGGLAAADLPFHGGNIGRRNVHSRIP